MMRRFLQSSLFLLLGVGIASDAQAITAFLKKVHCAHSLHKTIKDATSEKMDKHCAQAALDALEDKHKGMMKVATVFSGLKKKFNKLPAWQQNEIRYLLVQNLAGNTDFVGRDGIVTDLQTHILEGKGSHQKMTAGTCQTDLDVVVDAIREKDVKCLSETVKAMATVQSKRLRLFADAGAAEGHSARKEHLLLNPIYRELYELGGIEMLQRFMLLLGAAQLYGEQKGEASVVVKDAYEALKEDLLWDLHYNNFAQLSKYACQFEPELVFRVLTGEYGPMDGDASRGSVRYCVQATLSVLRPTFTKAKALEGDYFELAAVGDEGNPLVKYVMRYNKKRIHQLDLLMQFMLGQKKTLPKTMGLGGKALSSADVGQLYLNGVRDMQNNLGHHHKGLIKDDKAVRMEALDLVGHKPHKKHQDDMRVVPGVGVVFTGDAAKMHGALKAERKSNVREKYHKDLKPHAAALLAVVDEVRASRLVFLSPKTGFVRNAVGVFLTGQGSAHVNLAIREGIQYGVCGSYVQGLNASYAKFYHPRCMKGALKHGHKSFVPHKAQQLVEDILHFFIQNRGGQFYHYNEIEKFNKALAQFIGVAKKIKGAIAADEALIDSEVSMVKLSGKEKDALAVGAPHSPQRAAHIRQLKAGGA